MNETWRPALGYEGRLDVSDLGRVRTVSSVRTGERRGRIYEKFIEGTVLSPFLRNGYENVQPKFGDERKKLYVHRLVALAFVPGFVKGLTVNHINGVKTDNRAENLEWVSLARNTEHQWETGLVDLRGENHPGHKLTIAQVLAIRRMVEAGAARTDIAILAGVSASLVGLIVAGNRWRQIYDVD